MNPPVFSCISVLELRCSRAVAPHCDVQVTSAQFYRELLEREAKMMGEFGPQILELRHAMFVEGITTDLSGENRVQDHVTEDQVRVRFRICAKPRQGKSVLSCNRQCTDGQDKLIG